MDAKYQAQEKPKTTVLKEEDVDSKFDLLAQILKVREGATQNMALEAAVDKMGKVVVPDDHAPAAIAQKAETVGITKCKLNTLSTVLLGILAGVFIGLGAMFFTIVTTNAGLGFGPTRLLGGVVFCLGLILVVVAGAELFTGNTLIVMSWMSGRTSLSRLLRNWVIVYFANLAGALSLAGLVFASNQWALNGSGVGANALLIANAKVDLTFMEALTRGILCNALVCLAVWLCFSARTVMGKIAAIVFPITAFVAAGFEHSIANMYFIPLGILLTDKTAVLEAAKLTTQSVAQLNWAGFMGNLIPVTIGNVVGGAVLVGVVYWLTYLRAERAGEVVETRPWLRTVVRNPAAVEKKPTVLLPEPVRSQIDEIIRAKLEEPAVLDNGSKTLLAVLAKAKNDSGFLAKLAENPAEALSGYDLTAEDRAALSSGDIRWVERKLGKLDEPLRTWLTARMTQEKW